MKTYVTIGLLAHVDAGKTTLAERLLYQAGVIKEPGRVDHRDAFLDTETLEKERGITIFSKQAILPLKDREITLLDTPGHVDFSAEMERTLTVLDYAILIISGADGVQGHTRTLWDLLDEYRIPTFLFINKMDQPGTDREEVLARVKDQLNEACVPFDQGEPARQEAAALYREEALEEYVNTGRVSDGQMRAMIRARQIFPCYFGSALKGWGVSELMEGIRRYAAAPGEETGAGHEEAFGARIFKISRDPKGVRLTHMKLTGGTLKVRDSLPAGGDDPEGSGEKVNQIRVYSGDQYEVVPEAYAGQVVAVTGPKMTKAGEALGAEIQRELPVEEPVLTPVLTYQLLLPEGTDAGRMLEWMRQLEEEDPTLQVVWKEDPGEIDVRLMGEVQTQVLKSLIKARFGADVDFGPGSIVYKETIRNTVEGIGHFESLRHDAEVHLLLEPGETGSGLTFASVCRKDQLDQNWQNLILSSMREEMPTGVLTGAPLTDMKITLLAGRASEHTSGGDFRQAAERAVRQGLMQADSVLLEPWYTFTMELPPELTGRAMNDIRKMSGTYDPPQAMGEMTLITGTAPVSEMQEYPKELAAYSKGKGRISCRVSGYLPCHNPEEVIGTAGCDAEEEEKESPAGKKARGSAPSRRYGPDEEAELEEIFLRTYGKIRNRTDIGPRRVSGSGKGGKKGEEENLREYLLVDGYNVIHAWDELWDLAGESLDAARLKLQDILCNYQGFTGDTVILVFDAYKVPGATLETQKYHNIYVVYTKEAETADQYIEKVVHEVGRRYHVTVVTSDGVEQVITLGSGGTLKSSREFEREVEVMRQQIREEMEKQREEDALKGRDKNYLFDQMEDSLVREMEEIRLGKKQE